MAVTQEVFRLSYKVDGQQDMARLQTELDKLQARMRTFDELLKAGVITQSNYAYATRNIVPKVQAAQVALENYRKAAAGFSFGSENMGMAVLQLGNALEDLNYGLMGAINNVPVLIQAMGGSAGLAGVIAAVGAAVLVLSRNWDRIQAYFGQGIPQPALKGMEGLQRQLSKTTEEMEKLREKARLTYPELVRLGELQDKQREQQALVAQQEAVDAVKGMDLTREQARQGFAEGAAEFGGNRLMNKLRGALFEEADRNQLGLKGDADSVTAQLIEMANRGSVQAIEEIARLVPEAAVGISRGLPRTRRGVGLDAVVEGVKEDNARFAEQRAADQADSVFRRGLMEQGDTNMEEARRAALDAVPFAAERTQAGLLRRLGEGQGMEQAAKEVQANLAAALGDQLAPDDARKVAEAFTKQQLEGLRQGAARETLADPDLTRRRQLEMAQAQLGLMGMSQGPRTVSAGDFARNVQDSQKPLAEKMKESVDVQIKILDINRQQLAETRRLALVGP